jgi:hypothetical protein
MSLISDVKMRVSDEPVWERTTATINSVLYFLVYFEFSAIFLLQLFSQL